MSKLKTLIATLEHGKDKKVVGYYFDWQKINNFFENIIKN